MDITSNFRRKVKYHKPIIVFKELYRDYFKCSNKISSKLKLLEEVVLIQEAKPEVCFKNKSADHLSKYLMKNNPQYFSQTKLRRLKHEQSINKTRLSQSRDKTCIFRNLDRTKLQQLQKQKQSYFRNTFTESHPLFNINKGLKQKQITHNIQRIQHSLPQIFKQVDNTLKNPKNRRLELTELKQKLSQRQKIGRQKFAKIRHNYILSKCYLNKKKQQEDQFQMQKFKDNINFYKKHHNLSQNQFNRTKQNIFPETMTNQNLCPVNKNYKIKQAK